MCGRFSLISSEELIKRIFRLNRAPVQLRFNIAPSQKVPVIRITHNTLEREMVDMRWGLIPSWAKDIAIGNQLINARSETLFEKPAFRSAVKKRRCLIPTDGFFEWKKEGKKKQPYYIYLKDRQPFGIAGLWESWEGKDEETILSFTIITTEANELIRPLHERMPVIVPNEKQDSWLDTQQQSPDLIRSSLVPFPAQEMALHQVGDWVNNPRNDIPACIEPISEIAKEESLF